MLALRMQLLSSPSTSSQMPLLVCIDCACAWLRGTLPQYCIDALLLDQPLSNLRLLGSPPPPPPSPIYAWPNGCYYTDGAGGAHTYWPALRQRRCGIVVIADDTESQCFLFCAFLLLKASKIQAVPRAELSMLYSFAACCIQKPQSLSTLTHALSPVVPNNRGAQVRLPTCGSMLGA